MRRMSVTVVAIAVAVFLIFSSWFAGTIRGNDEEDAGKKDGQPDRSTAKTASHLWDHQGSVMALAMTRDGMRLVSAGAAPSESVVFWDLKTGRRLRGVSGAGLVYSASLSPDGKQVATAGIAGISEKNPRAKLAVWDAATGKVLFELKQASLGSRPCIAFSTDGKLLATGTVSGEEEEVVGAVQLWDAATGKKVGEPLVGPSEGFGQLAFSPDGKTLAAASWGKETFIVLWDIETRRQRAILKSRTTWTLIRSLAFSPDGKRLVSASGNESNGNAEQILWDVTKAQRIASLRTDEMTAGIAFDPQGKSLIAVGLGGGFHVWDLATLKKTASVEVELVFPTMVQSFVLSPDGKTLVLGTGNSDALALPDAAYGTIRLFDVATGRERLSPEDEARRARAEAEEAARQAVEEKAQARRREEQRQELDKLSPELRAKIERESALAARLRYALHLQQAQQDIERGLLSSARKLLQEYQPQDGQEDLRGFEWHYLWRQCQFQHIELEQQEAIPKSWQGTSPVLAPDGKTLAVVTVEHEVTLWDVNTGKERMTFKAASGPIWHLLFSPNGNYLATAGGSRVDRLSAFPSSNEKEDSSRREASLWDAQTGQRLARFTESKETITCLAFSLDGKTLAIGDQAGTVRLWEVPSGKQRASLSAGDESTTTLAFSPDGKTLAVGGANGRIALWDLAAQKETLLARGKEPKQIRSKQILSLHFGPENDVLYSNHGFWSNNYRAKRWQRNDVGTWTVARDWPRVHRLALSPDGKRVALSGWYGVALWDTDEDREIARIVPRVSGEGLESLPEFSPDSKVLLVQTDRLHGQPQLLLFDAENGEKLSAADQLLPGTEPIALHLGSGGKVTALAIEGGRRTAHTVLVLQTTLGQKSRSRHYDAKGIFGVTSLAFSPDDRRLVITNNESVFVWDLPADQQSQLYETNSLPIRKVRFASDGKTILAAHPPGTKILDATTGKERAAISASYGTLGGDGKSVYVPRAGGIIAVYSAHDGKEIAILVPKGVKPAAAADEDRDPWHGDVMASPGGTWIVNAEAVLFDVEAKQEIKHWDDLSAPVHLDFMLDEKTLVTTDRRGTLTLWDLPTLKERRVIPKAGIVIAFSPDHRTAVLTGTGDTPLLFDLSTGTELGRLLGLSASRSQFAFSPDGKSLVTGSADGMLRFWCPSTGVQRLSLRAHSAAVTSLAFSSDGTILATGGDRTVHVWTSRHPRK